MNWSNVAKGAAIVALLGSAPLQAGAMEIVGGTSPAAQMNEGFVQTVVIVRGPHGGAVVRPGVHGYHPGYRPGYGYTPAIGRVIQAIVPATRVGPVRAGITGGREARSQPAPRSASLARRP